MPRPVEVQFPTNGNWNTDDADETNFHGFSPRIMTNMQKGFK
jgi:hypothetical protein